MVLRRWLRLGLGLGLGLGLCMLSAWDCCAYVAVAGSGGLSRGRVALIACAVRRTRSSARTPLKSFVKPEPIHKINERIVCDPALELARSRSMDLVLITEEADPAVCKIVDYGKFLYAMEKKRKVSEKKQAKDEIKEVKLTPEIDEHDLDFKIRAAEKFIGEGDKVRVVVDFKGRQMAHTGTGTALLERFAKAFTATASVDGAPKMEGKSMSFLLQPSRKKKRPQVPATPTAPTAPAIPASSSTSAGGSTEIAGGSQ